MNYISLISTVALLNLLGAISPGPDFVMVVRNSLNHSVRVGVYTGLGIAMGLAVHLTYCAVGIAFLISQFHFLFSLIKYLGAAYLAYMGILSFRVNKTVMIEGEDQYGKTSMSALAAVKTGFLTNLLNPKATLFFLGLFSIVISPDVPRWVLLIISSIIVTTAIVWFSMVSFFFSDRRIKGFYFRYEKWVNYLFGTLLVLLAFKIAVI